MSELVSVARLFTREEAEVVRARLEDAGITASVFSDDAGGMLPTNLGHDVKVAQENAEAARAFVAAEDRPSAAPEGETP